MSFHLLTPRQIVAELDLYIVGQTAAKRAVAVALRNRFRRDQLDAATRAAIIPKNILMIGPTGVGKTEIARRLASLAGAPMLKIEATKFTEIGYVGREVDGIVRDLVDISIAMVEKERIGAVKDAARAASELRLLDLLAPRPARAQNAAMPPNPFGGMWPQAPGAPTEGDRMQSEQHERLRLKLATKLAAGELEESEVEVEVEEKRASNIAFMSPGMEEGGDMSQMLSGLFPQNKRKRRLKIKDARPILEHQEAELLLDRDAIVTEAIARAQENGIVFLDEIDKIAGREGSGGPQVSREGVQRDLLPLVEGATVNTKHGPVSTEHMLFIAAGAFHVSKPSDLIPELQGRFPIRVELEALTEEDLRRILTEPQNALINQYRALLGADGVELEWTDDGIAEIARFAAQVNESTENIGARRLHTLVEKVLEEVSFEAPEGDDKHVRINASFVRARLAHLVSDDDLSRFML